MKKILGIGNSLVDILIKMPNDDIIETLNFPKGSMQLISTSELNSMIEITQSMTKNTTAGGSAANTIVGLARLGAPVGLVGKIGKDETGGQFKASLVESGVEPHLLFSTFPSGRCHVLISPDSERTMRTYLGAASELKAEDITIDIFKTYDIVHVEGYLVQNYELMEKIGETAKEAGVKLSIDLASYNIVEENRDFLLSFVEKYVNIVFANEEESKAFTYLEPEAALDFISERVELAIVKVGAGGSFAKTKSEKVFVPANKVSAIDTTGAGDLYAGGFLYGFSNDMSLQRCAEVATACASEVIQVVGAKIPDDGWERIKGTL